LAARYRDPLQTPRELMHGLLEQFPTGSGTSAAGVSVVLLDNFEDLLDQGTGRVTDPELAEALRAVVTGPDHTIKVIITSRVTAREIALAQPGAHVRLGMDEGLPAPFAEAVLRARDPDGSLGLRHAPDDLLGRARERTRGFPRALEALTAILATDRDTTLTEVLAETSTLPENVTQALVGEAFARLDPLAQQVMQALAIYPVPVPPVAVDYLLAPSRPGIDAAPVLARLVNLGFARREAGHYYLHQVDKDYALGRLPVDLTHATGRLPDTNKSDHAGGADDDPTGWTREACWARAAGYFETTRTPRETWKTLDDLAPQLAEFQVRAQAGQHDAAAQTLQAIAFDYLMLWGHNRQTISLYEQVLDHVIDPWTRAGALNNLGLCHATLGRAGEAIEHHRRALTICRETGNRNGEATDLGNLGNCYVMLGQTGTAIEHYERALMICRETGNRNGEAADLIGLGLCAAALGRTGTAIEHFERALMICRETGNRDGEAADLTGLGSCYATFGHVGQAIEHQRRALAISGETGNRYLQAGTRRDLADAQAALGSWPACSRQAGEAIRIGDEIGTVDVRSEARLTLATAFLVTGDVDAAGHQEGRRQGQPRLRPHVHRPDLITDPDRLPGLLQAGRGGDPDR